MMHQKISILVGYTVGLPKNATINGSIIEGEEDFGASFGIKTGQFTWRSAAF